MDEKKVTALLEQLFIHVAAMPWKDTEFMRSAVVEQAAKDAIVQFTAKEIIKLHEESKDGQA